MLLDARAVGGVGGGAPLDATFIVQTPNATLTNEQALSALATGILKSTTATGVVSIAAAGVDYLSPADIGVTVEAWDADLDTLAGLAKADGNFIVGDGAAWVVESGATARISLGLGSLAVLNSPLPILNGGSGQTTQQAAIDALTNVSAATNEHVLTKDTGTGNAIFKAAAGGSSLPVADTQTIVKGSADATKLLRFEVDGFTAGATRVLTPPNADATIAGLEVANVFTADQTVQGFLTVTRNSSNPTVQIQRTGDIVQLWEFGKVSSGGEFNITDVTAGFDNLVINKNVPYKVRFYVGGIIINDTALDADFIVKGDNDTELLRTDAGNDRVGIGIATPLAKLHIVQSSATAARPVLRLRQADLSEEFIRFDATVGAGNPIDTAALGAYYGKVRVYVEGVGAKFIALYD